MENGLISNTVWDIEIDQSHTAWFHTNLGISKFNGKTWMSWEKTNESFLNYVMDLQSDFSGNVWIGTSNGVNRWNGNSFDTYLGSEYLDRNWINKITIDTDGTIFFFSYGGGGGISSFNGFDWKIYKDIIGRVNAKDSNGKLLVIEDGNIYKFNQQGVDSIKINCGSSGIISRNISRRKISNGLFVHEGKPYQLNGKLRIK